MYYSFKTTLFDDKSPSYAKAIRHKKKCVFINYNIPTGYTYLYEIKKTRPLLVSMEYKKFIELTKNRNPKARN